MSTQSQLTVLLTARARLQEAYEMLDSFSCVNSSGVEEARNAGHDLPEEVHNLSSLEYHLSGCVKLLDEMIDRLNSARLSQKVKEGL